jgi:SOS-response transcriptional repressor LexA
MANKRMEDETISKAIEVYDAIVWHMDSEGGAPVVRELMVMTNILACVTVQQYLRILRDWGWITWEPYKSRTMRLTRPTEATVIRRRPFVRRKVKHIHVA